MTGESAHRRGNVSPQPGGRSPAPGELALVQAFINTHYDLEVSHGAELLATTASAGRWLKDRHLLDDRASLDANGVHRLRRLREGLRELAADNAGASGALRPAPSSPHSATSPASGSPHSATLPAAASPHGALRPGAANAHDHLRSGPATAFEQLNEAGAGAAVELRFAEDGPQFVAAAAGELDGAIGLLLAITARAMLSGSWARLKICPGEDCGWAFYDHSRNQTGRWCSMSVCGARAKARAHYRRRRGEPG